MASMLKRFRRSGPDPETNDPDTYGMKMQYTYSEVVDITSNFSTMIGRGGTGEVYLGFIDSIQVAVKMMSESASQGKPVFESETKLLMFLYHKNIISMVGYCNDKKHKGIIYQYIDNKSLMEHLSDESSSSCSLSWERRLQIALNVAQGVEYLHNGCKPAIIHRDVKTSNILLNEQYEAILSDFGLAVALPAEDGSPYISDIVCGTHGYIDPEYFQSNRVTVKSDVYGFGIVLLMIITGKAPIVSTDEDCIHIADWVYSIVNNGNGNVRQIIDQRLSGKYNVNSVWKVLELALTCTSAKSSDRPSMDIVALELKDCLKIEFDSQDANSNNNLRISKGKSFVTETSIRDPDSQTQGLRSKINEWNIKSSYSEVVDITSNFNQKIKSFVPETLIRDPDSQTQGLKSKIKERNRQYTYTEVVDITSNFNKRIGEGAYGEVYYGLIDDHVEVAVKMLSKSSIQGRREFETEVMLLMRVSHKNIASLVGYCNESTHMGIIYEYMTNKSLYDHLSGSSSGISSWERRLMIALNVAEGLEYLHNGCKPAIIHRDVKTSIILLNEQYEAILSGFGLSMPRSAKGGTPVIAGIAGTPGYIDPE